MVISRAVCANNASMSSRVFSMSSVMVFLSGCCRSSCVRAVGSAGDSGRHRLVLRVLVQALVLVACGFRSKVTFLTVPVNAYGALSS